MKKYIAITLIVAMLVATLVVLTGCTNDEGNNNGNGSGNGKSAGVDLKLDFQHMNGKTYTAHINTSSNDKITTSEDEPNYVTIENEKDNYTLELTLDTEAKEAYEQLKTSARDDNEVYEDVMFGKNEGYYSKDNGDIYGYVLLDSSDSTFDVYVMFNLYLLDEDSENKDIDAIYNSSAIQDILNNIQFKN